MRNFKRIAIIYKAFKLVDSGVAKDLAEGLQAMIKQTHTELTSQRHSSATPEKIEVVVMSEDQWNEAFPKLPSTFFDSLIFNSYGLKDAALEARKRLGCHVLLITGEVPEDEICVIDKANSSMFPYAVQHAIFS